MPKCPEVMSRGNTSHKNKERASFRLEIPHLGPMEELQETVHPLKSCTNCSKDVSLPSKEIFSFCQPLKEIHDPKKASITVQDAESNVVQGNAAGVGRQRLRVLSSMSQLEVNWSFTGLLSYTIHSTLKSIF